MPEFDANVLKHRLVQAPGLMQQRSTNDGYLDELEALYNHSARRKRLALNVPCPGGPAAPSELWRPFAWRSEVQGRKQTAVRRVTIALNDVQMDVVNLLLEQGLYGRDIEDVIVRALDRYLRTFTESEPLDVTGRLASGSRRTRR